MTMSKMTDAETFDVVRRMEANGGIRWAMRELNVTEDDAKQLLSDAGKAECQACHHILTADVVDENELCANCAPCEYCE
jgi:hypothetical protein